MVILHNYNKFSSSERFSSEKIIAGSLRAIIEDHLLKQAAWPVLKQADPF